MAGAGTRMRKLAAKNARRKAVVTAKKKAEVSSSSLSERIRSAASCPIARCVMPAGLFDIGIGHVILARSLPSGLLGCAFFVVDPFCLGIKDAFYAEIAPDELRSRMEAQSEFQAFVDTEPSRARKLINDVVAYATGLGLAPAKDFMVVETLFGAVDAAACAETFTFGKDGKPFYVTGPLDTPARIRSVSRILQDRFGTGGWDFLVQMPPE